jgi:hypothetical protein
MRSLANMVLLGLVLMLCSPLTGSAQSQRYVLSVRSSISTLCAGCSEPQPGPQRLEGSFEITALPVDRPFAVAAVHRVHLRAGDVSITGNGFWQRLGPQHQAMVLDVEVNGARMLLRSGPRQRSAGGGFAIVLSSGRATSPTYVLLIDATAVPEDAPDSDGDGIADSLDNCVQEANSSQENGDGDGVGDACDRCSGTGASEAVTRNGCSLAQLCPCSGPRGTDEPWDSVGAYLRCVSKGVRRLKQEAGLSRPEARTLIKDAVQSGCGRTIVAMR